VLGYPNIPTGEKIGNNVVDFCHEIQESRRSMTKDTPLEIRVRVSVLRGEIGSNTASKIKGAYRSACSQ